MRFCIRVMLLGLVSSNSFAGGAVADLTDPKYKDLAAIYPKYAGLLLADFDTSPDIGLKNTSIFWLKSKDNPDREVWDVRYTAIISSNIDGKQRLFIDLSSTRCSERDAALENMVIRTNEKNVLYAKVCNGRNWTLSTKTPAGTEYFINEFKTKDVVVMDFGDLRVRFATGGFTKAWNNYGGDAL